MNGQRQRWLDRIDLIPIDDRNLLRGMDGSRPCRQQEGHHHGGILQEFPALEFIFSSQQQLLVQFFHDLEY